MESKRELTTKELCEYLGVSSVSIERYRKKKGLPFIKRGRNVYFIAEDIDIWLKEYKKTTEFNYAQENKENTN